MIDETALVLERLEALAERDRLNGRRDNDDDDSDDDDIIANPKDVLFRPREPTTDEQALAGFVRSAEQLAIEIDDVTKRVFAEPQVLFKSFSSQKTSSDDAEARLKECSESVKSFCEIVDVAEKSVRDPEECAAFFAHLRATCRAMCARMEDSAALLKKRKQAALEREKARAKRYNMLPGQSTAASIAVRRRPAMSSAPAMEDDETMMVDLNTATLDIENDRLVEQITAHEMSPITEIEQKLVEIAEMQSTVAQKVMEQADDIEVLREQAGRSLDNIDEANRALRKALQKDKKTGKCCCCGGWCGWCCGTFCRDCHWLTCTLLVVLGTLILLVNWTHS